MKFLSTLVVILCICTAVTSQHQNITPVSYEKVKINDTFWSPKISTVASVTVPVCIQQTEVATPRIRNFEKVARKKGEKHEGIYYDDSDVYKALEAIAYSLKTNPDAALGKKADEWIDKIAAAQEPDGYLNTYYSLVGLDKRWTDMEKHEDYCAGHLLEAAVAYYNTTGKRKLLDVAIRFADHIDATFPKQNRHWVSGHQEIELALVKLYHATNNKKYLELSDWFLQQRGKGYGKGVIWDQWKVPEYCQDQKPVESQTEITGHAVRAMYLYTGAADVAAETGNTQYTDAMKRVWEDVVYRNMYITGGIGSSGRNEGFTIDYDLPNEQAYCETCASVGMVFWNQRMNLLTGDSKYFDVLERSLYNGALAGLSLSGDRFFYGNPLASNGNYQRSEWFGTACCPSNISRLVASIGQYIYATSKDAIWVNLFVSGSTVIPVDKSNITITQKSNYPWDGNITITVSPDKKIKHAVKIRIPGWAKGEPAPGETYRYLTATKPFTILLNNKSVPYTMENGYAVIDRDWKKADVITIDLPMEVQRVVATDKIAADKGRVALERGPVVYCLEQVDNNNSVFNIFLPDNVSVQATLKSDLLGGVVVLQASGSVVETSADGLNVSTQSKTVTAVPYFTWANRGAGKMQVWLPRKVTSVSVD